MKKQKQSPTPAQPKVPTPIETLTETINMIGKTVAQTGSVVASIAERVKYPKAHTYEEGVPIASWRVAEKQSGAYSYTSGSTSDLIADPATVVSELRTRVETLSKLGMLSQITIDLTSGTLILAARRKLS